MEYFILESMTSGERFVYEYLKGFENDTYKIIPNALYNREEGGTNQIDFLVLNSKGLFVIEHKDFNGWIFGHENQVEWTQTFQDGSKHKFRNPLKQNENHIKTIKRLFEANSISIPIYNLVVFSDTAILKSVSGTGVINFCDIHLFMDSYPDIIYKMDQYDSIYSLLDSERVKDPLAYESHIEYAKSLNEKNSFEAYGFERPHAKSKNKKKYKNYHRKSAYPKYKLAILAVLILYYIFSSMEYRISGNSSQKLDNSNDFEIAKQTNTPVNEVNNNPSENIAQTAVIVRESNDLIKQVENISIEQITQTTAMDEESVFPANQNQSISTEPAIQTIIKEDELIEIGISKSEVVEILGPPDSIELTSVETLIYKNSWIALENNLVIAWQNTFDQLSDYLPIKTIGASPVFIGSTKDEVIKVFGAPTLIEYDNPDTYYYGNSYFTFDSDGRLDGYDNKLNQLSDALVKKKINASIVKIGSSKDEVLSRMGPPTKISKEEADKYYYKSAYIKFNEVGTVVEYNNILGYLKYDLQMANPNAKRVGIGASKEEVMEVLGAPTSIMESNPDRFNYNSAYMLFDESGILIEYDNVLNGLKYGLAAENGNAPRIGIGASKKDVIAVLGGPTRILASDPNKFYYRSAYLKFDNDGYLIEYDNVLNALKYGLTAEDGNAPRFDIGATKAEVIAVLGGPTRILASDPNKFYYGSAYLKFDNNGDLIEYDNVLNKLRYGLYQENISESKIKIGSSKDEVLNFLGGASRVLASEQNKYYYKNSYIEFDQNGTVVSINNMYDQLTKYLDAE